MSRHFSNEEVQMDIKYMKSSGPLVMKEIQIKTILRVYLIPVRMAIMKKKKQIKVLVIKVGGMNSYLLLVRMEISEASMENSMKISHKIKNRTLI
jgi:hypothetical protein